MLGSTLWQEHLHLQAKYPDRPLPPELQKRMEDKRVKRFPDLQEGIPGPIAPGVITCARTSTERGYFSRAIISAQDYVW